MKPALPFALLPEHIAAFPALSALRERLAACGAIALAYSGGLDSRFLAHVAATLVHAGGEGLRLHLFHITGPHVPQEETREAIRQAEAMRLPLTLVPLNPLEIAGVRVNGEDRCYHCKRHLFARVAAEAAAHPAFGGRTPVLCDGTNVDDLTAYRPGAAALKELGVRSPLAESGIGKKDIRAAGALIGFANPDQQARPCLLTRFAYRLEPDEGCLQAVQEAEAGIAHILSASFAETPDFRLRLSPAASDISGIQRNMPPAAGGDNPPRPPLICACKVDKAHSAPVIRPPRPLLIFPHKVEVHIAAEVTPEVKIQVREAVTGAGFLPPEVVCMESVQGWFDRER